MTTSPTAVGAEWLIELTRAALPTAAGAFCVRPSARAPMRPLIAWGYREPVRRFLSSAIVSDPAFTAVVADPDRPLFWEDLPGFRNGPTVRSLLAPAGFREGTSMALTNGGELIGAMHLSFDSPDVPTHARRFLACMRPRLLELARGTREPSGAALTRRELDVLRLLADGATNRRIAGTLGIAASTVGSHVEHIYAKLGVSSRAAAVAAAARDHLLR
ncbi:helix-turn-helix transcriptional regulator [Tsukamurella sp. USMM236]|uniref:helix-turn-helix transcriptional regulator n=1 Tax=Tsukamurella sp. USMM236 TaxID=3081301 RepID=UPI00301A739A